MSRPAARTKGKPSSPSLPSWLPSAGAAALALVTVLVYANSFAGVFIGDDEQAIVQNTTIRSLSPAVFSPPADTTVAARPFANLTFAINYAIAGGTANLWSYHAVNLAIHILTALALFGLVRRTLRSPALRDQFDAVQAMYASFAIAALWVLHPLHTQAVTFLAQRVEALMGFFYVTTIYCVVRAAETNFASRSWTIAAVIASALGMATKETMIGAPVVAAAWIWICWPQQETSRPRALLIGLAATMVIAIGLAMQGARSASAGFGAGGWTSMQYLRTQAAVIIHYIQLAFWPHPLVFQYAWLPAESSRAVWPQAVLLVSMAAGTLIALVRRRPIALAGVWFFLILAPSSSIVPVATEVAAEHRMYLPLAAIVAVVVFGLRSLVKRTHVPVNAVTEWAGRTAVILTCVFLGVATHERNSVYASAETMAEDVVRVRPQNPHAQLTYGTFLVGRQRFAEAEPHLRAAMSLPLPPSTDESKMRSLAHLYLGLSLVGVRRTDEGSRELEQAIALRPDLDRAYPALAESQLSLRQASKAVATLEHAITRQPDEVALRKRIAWILATSSDDAARSGARAIEHAQRAVELTGGRDPVALDTLAAAHAEAGRFDDALNALGQAASLVRASGPADFIPTLRVHLELFEAKRPVRTKDW